MERVRRADGRLQDLRSADGLHRPGGAPRWVHRAVRRHRRRSRLPSSALRYIFADLDQRQFSLTTRLNLLLTPTISLQTYLQPLLAVGRYWGIKEFTRPRAFEFARYGEEIGTIARDVANAEYSIDPDGDGPAALFSVDDPDYNLKSLRLQTVFRWEFRPGSTLYVVWTEGRRDEELPGQFDFGRDARRLFNSPSDDVFAVKVAYWFGR